jgi:phospholipid/cholesterol/gamma-HCH transport system substrate-binding protein
MQDKPSAHINEPFVRRHRPFFVGLFVLIPVFTIPALLVFSVIKNDSWQKWCTLHMFYRNSQGLKKGNQVSMSGTAIGHVRDVDLIRERKVHVAIDINDRYRHLVKKNTKARLKQRGFVGDWEIELAGGTRESPNVEDGDTLMIEKVPALDDFIEVAVGVIDTATSLLNTIAAIIKGLEAGEGTAGQVLKNDTLFRNINQAAANTVGITSGAIRITGDARNTIRGVDSLLAVLTGVGKDGAAVVDTLASLINTVNKTIEEAGGILKNLKTVSDETPELMDRLKGDLEEVELLMNSLQRNWLIRGATGGDKPKNPKLTDSP